MKVNYDNISISFLVSYNITYLRKFQSEIFEKVILCCSFNC